MILAEIILAGLLLSLATGGSVRHLGQVRLRGEWILLVLLPAQLLWPAVLARFRLDCETSLVIWLVMMGGISAILLINSRRRWTLALAALGVLANMLVISSNGAMPVDIKAASEMGVARADVRNRLREDCLHVESNEDSKLRFLGDYIVVPGPNWQRSVISPGDLLLSLGLSSWIFVMSRRTLRE